MTKTPVLDRVREACREVAGKARHVAIDEQAIPAYAASISAEQLALPELDPDCHYLGRGRDTAAFILALEAVNFGSGYFPALAKTMGSSGYFTVARSLRDLYETQGPLSAADLARLDAAACARIFGQDPRDETIRELMALFALALNELGRHLLDRFDGSFTELIAAAGGSAERLVELLAAMPRFHDVASYQGRDVPFYKRAQLTAADLSLAFGGAGPGRFADLDRLTIFADNQVPHVLRVDGLLRYDAALAARVDAGELIAAQSPEEVEIRACAVHAAELLVAELRRAGCRVTAREVDYYLWNRGLGPEYRARSPHRTQTIYY